VLRVNSDVDMSSESDLAVTVDVAGVEMDEQQQHIIELYEQNIETFIRKNEDYGNSFEDSAKVESVIRYGEVREDEIAQIAARQIFVRGLMDKISRFYTLMFLNDDTRVNDEDITDTLLDLANYAIMLTSILESYGSENAS
jgi:hypothetical protein